MSTLADALLDIQSGKSFQTAEIQARPDELGVIKVSAVTWSHFQPSECKALKGEYSPDSNHRIRQGDLLISRANTKEFVGAVVLVEDDYPMRLLSDKTLRLVVDESIACKEYLLYALRAPEARRHIEHFATGTSDSMRNISQGVIASIPVDLPLLKNQRRIATHLKAQLSEVEQARQAVGVQLYETAKLADSIIADSIKNGRAKQYKLGDVLEEVKQGIGETWNKYPVLGATRAGLAPAREPAGKKPERYKPVFPGTVFYNPMRILIGSIAYVDDDDTPGITSPDYVVLRGKVGDLDSRWFYYWLRSPLGERCINSLTRGAVRERMLFNRLAEGKADLPKHGEQIKASNALAEIKPMGYALDTKLKDINMLSQKILTQAFEM